MKQFALFCSCLVGALFLVAAFRFADDFIAPLFLNSRIERMNETGLPKALVEKGDILYCRMKADDFRLPLPSGSQVVPPLLISGGFDTVDGTVEVHFEGLSNMTPDMFEGSLSGKLQVGGSVSAESVPGGMKIKFHYFGDR